nr:hypothetical protein BaRGS_003788 [Batillaria attramentaria]
MTIGSLQSDLVTVKTELTSLQTRLAQQESSFAFSAHYSHYGVQVNGDAVLKFNAVPTNIGGGYNSGTGKFTAPVSGVYLFLLHIINGDGDQKIEVDLVKSGTPIGKAIAEGSEQRYDKASAAATVHLYAGDTVYAAHSHLFLGAVLDGGWLCSFTGVLVTPDVA